MTLARMDQTTFNKIQKYFGLLIIILAVLWTEFIAISKIDLTSREGLERLIFLGSWASLPYLVLFGLITRKNQSDKQRYVKLIGTILISAFGLLIIRAGAHPNLIGPVLLFIPIWQLIGCAIMAVISWVIKRRMKREQDVGQEIDHG
jgi:hypothetical protein